MSELNGSEDFSKQIIQTVSVASSLARAYKWQLWVPAACKCWQPFRSARKVIKKKIALDNLKVKSPIEHLWSWKETCLNAHSSPLLAYLLPSHAKHVPAGDKDSVGANQSPGHARAMHPGLGLGDYSCSWALLHPLHPRTSLSSLLPRGCSCHTMDSQSCHLFLPRHRASSEAEGLDKAARAA